MLFIGFFVLFRNQRVIAGKSLASLSHMSSRKLRARACAIQSLENRTLLAGDGLAGAYFARTNVTLARFSEVDPAIDFAWDGGTPAASLGTDGFSVRWSGQVLGKYSEAHTFIVTSAGGVRLWVNGGLIIDDWSSHSLQEDTGVARLTAGKLFSIRLEYWNDGNSPQVKLEWQSNRMGRSVIPTNRLYADPLDNVAPTAPRTLRASFEDPGTVDLTWTAPKTVSGLVDYDVYVGTTKVASLLANQTSYTRTHLSASTAYSFSVQAIDAAGNMSPLATTAITTAAGGSAVPSVPNDLQVTNISSNSVSLQWNASTDDGHITGYRVYRDGVKLGVAPAGTSFTDTGLSAATHYTYSVRAADDSGLFSGFSNPVSTTTVGASSHDAFSSINAADFDDSDGVIVNGNEIDDLDDGDWTLYQNVDFGNGVKSVQLNLAMDPGNEGGSVELHLDSVDGTLIGKHDIQPTGSWDTFINQGINVSDVSGTHDLYLVFTGRQDMGNLRSFTFSSQHLVKIMPLGDSITQAFNGTPSYRWYLWQKLQDAGFATDFVGSQMGAANGDPPNFDFDQDHEGHSGWTADQIAANAAAWAAEFQPDIVLMHAGSNDAEQHQSTDGTINDLRNIINAIRSVDPNVIFLVAQLIPDAVNNAGIDDLNSRIPALVSSMDSSQSRVILVDLHTGFSGSDTFDGVHLTSSGENKMAQRWFDALSDLLQ